jgi:predicted acyltransferase
MASPVTEQLPVTAGTNGPPAVQAKAPVTPSLQTGRLVSLDAYRGFIMIVLASGGLALPEVTHRFFADRPLWQFLAFHTDHVEWVGCSFWDLIQPSFMFMVGVAMPFSFASRKNRGESPTYRGLHVLYRALVLIALGIFLSSNWSNRTNFTFVNVLTQIGLGYPFLYLLLGRGWRIQVGALAGILVGYWLLFLCFPLPGPGFDYAAVGWKDWVGQPGWWARWDKNTNAAAAFDHWFLNLFPAIPPKTSFDFNEGGYQTLNFIPSLATMLLGLMAGEMLHGPRRARDKLLILVAAGLGCLGVGYLAGMTVCPLVKRIWTPSWAVYCAGWTFLMLAGFYAVIDLGGWRRWSYPLVVVGMNSIAIYCMGQLLKGWVKGTLATHWPTVRWAGGLAHLSIPDVFAPPYGLIVQSAGILLVFWLVCLWMYRRGIFLRI